MTGENYQAGKLSGGPIDQQSELAKIKDQGQHIIEAEARIVPSSPIDGINAKEQGSITPSTLEIKRRSGL